MRGKEDNTFDKNYKPFTGNRKLVVLSDPELDIVDDIFSQLPLHGS